MKSGVASGMRLAEGSDPKEESAKRLFGTRSEPVSRRRAGSGRNRRGDFMLKHFTLMVLTQKRHKKAAHSAEITGKFLCRNNAGKHPFDTKTKTGVPRAFSGDTRRPSILSPSQTLYQAAWACTIQKESAELSLATQRRAWKTQLSDAKKLSVDSPGWLNGSLCRFPAAGREPHDFRLSPGVCRAFYAHYPFRGLTPFAVAPTVTTTNPPRLSSDRRTRAGAFLRTFFFSRVSCISRFHPQPSTFNPQPV